MKLLLVIILLQAFLCRKQIYKKQKNFSKLQREKRLKKQDQGVKYEMPENLSDGNGDGYVEEGDFVRVFKNQQLSLWELRKIFKIVDIGNDGKVDIQEWRNFHDMFIKKFKMADKNSTNFLDKDEVTESIKDIPGVQQFLQENDTTIQQVMYRISSHPKTQGDKLNFFEWLFFRRCCIAWNLSSGRDKISKNELLDMGVQIVNPWLPSDVGFKQTLYAALDWNQEQATYNFVESFDVLHKYMIYDTMLAHGQVTGQISKNKLLQCINEDIGPSEIFLIDNQTKEETLTQIFLLAQDKENTGFDFYSFYHLVSIIYNVIQYGDINSGSLNFDEFKDMISKEKMYTILEQEISKSFIEKGDYLKQLNYTLDAEVHAFSGGRVNPVELQPNDGFEFRRMNQINSKNRQNNKNVNHFHKNNRLNTQNYHNKNNINNQLDFNQNNFNGKLLQNINRRLKKDGDISDQKKKELEGIKGNYDDDDDKKDDDDDDKKDDDKKDDDKKDDDKRNMTLSDDPYIYFYNQFQTHKNGYINYGDIFRLFKYFLIFDKWDRDIGFSRLFQIFPDQLEEVNKEQQKELNVFKVTIFLREKEIMRNSIQLYKKNGQLDYVTESLPIDFLGFVRFMNFELVKQRITRNKISEDVSYNSLYLIFQKIGLIPFNLDLDNWLKELKQGQASIMLNEKSEEINRQGQKVVDGEQQFYKAQLRNSKQLLAQNQFGDSQNHMDLNIFSLSPKRLNRRQNKRLKRIQQKFKTQKRLKQYKQNLFKIKKKQTKQRKQ